jgi:hypothetical protein
MLSFLTIDAVKKEPMAINNDQLMPGPQAVAMVQHAAPPRKSAAPLLSDLPGAGLEMIE